MTPELQLVKSLLDIFKEQRKDIVKLRAACVALRRTLVKIDPSLDNFYEEQFDLASAVPSDPADAQVDALLEQIIQLIKTGTDSVH